MVNLPLDKEMPPGAVTYAVNAELTSFAADKLLLGQKVEPSSLKVNAATDGYQIKGDVKINGLPASIDVRKKKNDINAELRMQATVDEAARRRLGIDFGGAVTGSIPLRLTGYVGDNVRDERMNVEADLTSVKIDNLLPGWVKPAGKPARATYTLIKTGKMMRFDDLNIEGSGATVKGTVDLDANNNLVAASFPVFSLSDGDKVSLKADRSSEGILRVTMRGDVYDGRAFVKSALAGVDEKASRSRPISISISRSAPSRAITARPCAGLICKLSRRGGRIRSFCDEFQDRPRHAVQRRHSRARP